MPKPSYLANEIISASELADLHALQLEIAALQEKCASLYQPNWFAAAAQARLEFRKNPSVAGADKLLDLLILDPEHALNNHVFGKVRDDLILGAGHLFKERALPALERIAARAARLTDETIERTLAYDKELAGNAHERFAGPLPKTKQIVALEEQAGMIAALRARVSTPPAPGQFPVGIAETLGQLGVEIEMQISEWAPNPVDMPDEKVESVPADFLTALDDVQLRAAALQYGLVIEEAAFDREATIRTILAIAPQ